MSCPDAFCSSVCGQTGLNPPREAQREASIYGRAELAREPLSLVVERRVIAGAMLNPLSHQVEGTEQSERRAK